MESAREDKRIWTSFEMARGQVRQWRIGPLDLWVEHTEHEWRTASRLAPERDQGGAEEVVCDQLPDDLEVRRWTVGDTGETKLLLRPAMPDRPVAVRTADPVVLLPGSEASFFVGVPIWIELLIGAEDGQKLLETPTVVLSNSWFGTPAEGEVCYALRSRARRNFDELEDLPYRTICPTSVRNESSEPLSIQRLFLRTAPLSIFRGDRYLWSNAGTLRYHGEEKPGQIVYEKKPPGFDHAGAVLRKAREPGRTSFLAKSLGGLKAAFAVF